ncbi:MAG: MerR family transcriptional regulator [Alistipes sp.]|nr:MerR family transcriptional regulator [Alistipes sp.]
MCAKQTGKIYYSMGEVTEMFDVNPSLIRFWESKFDILKPHKNKKGNRLFTPADIENLKLIYHLVKEKGMTLSGAQKLIKSNREGINRDLEVIDRLLGIKALLAEIKQELGVGADFEADPDEEYEAAAETDAAPVAGTVEFQLDESIEARGMGTAIGGEHARPGNYKTSFETEGHAGTGGFVFASDEVDMVAGTNDDVDDNEPDDIEGYTEVGDGTRFPEAGDGYPGAENDDTLTAPEYPAVSTGITDGFPDPADEMETVFAGADSEENASFTGADIPTATTEQETVSDSGQPADDTEQPEDTSFTVSGLPAGPDKDILHSGKTFQEQSTALYGGGNTEEPASADLPEAGIPLSGSPAPAVNPWASDEAGQAVTLSEQVQQIVANNIEEIAGEQLPQEYIGELSDEIAEEAATAAEVREALAELDGSREKKGPDVYEQTLFDF